MHKYSELTNVEERKRKLTCFWSLSQNMGPKTKSNNPREDTGNMVYAFNYHRLHLSGILHILQRLKSKSLWHIYTSFKQTFWRELLPLMFQVEAVAKTLNTGKQSKTVTLRAEAKCIIQGWGRNNLLKWKTTKFSNDVNRMVLHRPEQ